MDTAKIKAIYDTYDLSKYTDDKWNWLDHLNASQAYVVCLGAGPWKIRRRSIVQQRAVDILGSRDLSELSDDETLNFPLGWQKQKLQTMIAHLKRSKFTMTVFAERLKQADFVAVTRLYTVTKTKGRAKVLDLYARDYLKVSSFPIDRWVARRLKALELPQDEFAMILLCEKAGIDPRYFARMLVSDGNFTGNYVVKV